MVEVDVTLKLGKISGITIGKSLETTAVSELPKRVIPQMIVDHQSLGISGATFTSFAILSAVKDALKKAEVDPKTFTTSQRYSYKVPVPGTRSADVVVVGGGGAGLSAAVSAAQVGASVILFEKMSFMGGNTVLAGGALNAADPALDAEERMSEGQRKMVDALLAEKPKSDLNAKLIAQCKAKWDAHIAKTPDVLFDCEELHALQTYKAGDYAADLALINNCPRLLRVR